MKILKVLVWGLLIGAYYAIAGIGGAFIGAKFGESIADVVLDQDE